MSKTKPDKTTPCPFCADPDLLERILASKGGTPVGFVMLRRTGSHWRAPRRIVRTKHPKISRWGAIDPRFVVTLRTPEVARGDYRIRTITDEDMIRRYAGYKIEVVGEVVGEQKPANPSGPFLGLDRDAVSREKVYVAFNAARVTRKGEALSLEYHWHASHGRRVAIKGFAERLPTKQELEFLNAAFGLDAPGKQRGAPPKVDREAVVRAVRKLGGAATQKSVAEATGTAPRTLRDWLYFQEGASWAMLKREILEKAAEN